MKLYSNAEDIKIVQVKFDVDEHKKLFQNEIN